MAAMILFASCEKLPPEFFLLSTPLVTTVWTVLYNKYRTTGSSRGPSLNFGIFLVLLQQPLLYCVYRLKEENEMGGACDAYGRGERGAQGVGRETRGKEAIGEIQT
jgi:hypothetical protein